MIDNEAEKSAQDIAREFLLGELIGAATRQLRALDKPWLRLSEEDQRKVLRDVQESCEEAVTRTVELIATDDRTSFRAQVEQVVFKDGVKAVLTMANTPDSHELADTTGGSVYIVIESPQRYLSPGSNMPEADPQQGSML